MKQHINKCLKCHKSVKIKYLENGPETISNEEWRNGRCNEAI